jgi:hypothetical protein
MSYKDDVRAAAAALNRGEEENWKLARLTYENTLESGDTRRQRDEGKVSMREWCEDVRAASGRAFSEKTGTRYKAIWARFGTLSQSDRARYGLPPRGGPSRLSWAEAYDTVDGRTMQERLGGFAVKNSLTYATPEQKREAFDRLSRDDDVVSDPHTSSAVLKQIAHSNPAAVETAWRDTETNIALSQARYNAREETLEPMRQAAREAQPIFEPQDRTLDRHIFFADVATKVDHWARELAEIRDFLERSDDVDHLRRWSTRQAFERLVKAATACRDVLPSSSVPQTADPKAHHSRRLGVRD